MDATLVDWKVDRQRLLDAMVKAEGGPDRFVKAVRCSFPSCKDFDEAISIAVNTINHRLWTWMTSKPLGIDLFIGYLGSFWAPVPAPNDPNHLNANWVPNVTRFYHDES